MALDLEKLRKLVSLDKNDPLSRFALGKKLFETGELAEAAEHLRFANAADPQHLATYHILSQALIQLGKTDEARQVLQAGIPKVMSVGQGMGRDLGPAMQKMFDQLNQST
jgi:predicted Zn-dependent protease